MTGPKYVRSGPISRSNPRSIMLGCRGVHGPKTRPDRNHDEEAIENKEVVDLVDFGCGKSGTNLICSCMSGNSHFEAMRVKHIMVNSSNTDRKSNFNRMEISREEYEDRTGGPFLSMVEPKAASLSLAGLWKFDMWEWRKRKTETHIKFRFCKFNMWEWRKRKKIGDTKYEFEYKKWNFDVWRWPLRKIEGEQRWECKTDYLTIIHEENMRVNMNIGVEDFVVGVVGSEFLYKGIWQEHAFVLKALFPLSAKFLLVTVQPRQGLAFGVTSSFRDSIASGSCQVSSGSCFKELL
nr:glycosyl transferase, family 1 [Tanacetum cinerariifolium]